MAAIAEDETTAATADSSATISEPASVPDPSADTSTIDTPTNDGTIAVSPAESDAK